MIMKKEIVDLIIREILERKEEVIRLEIKDRVAYIGFLVQEISGIPALYLPINISKKIFNEIGKEIRLTNNHFF